MFAENQLLHFTISYIEDHIHFIKIIKLFLKITGLYWLKTKGVRIRSESESDPIRSDSDSNLLGSDRIGSFFYCRIGSDFVGFLSDRIGLDFFFIVGSDRIL
jgi:hypothetical protein